MTVTGTTSIENYVDKQLSNLLFRRIKNEKALSRSIDLLHQLAGDSKVNNNWRMAAGTVMSGLDMSKPAVIAAHSRYRECRNRISLADVEMRQVKDAWNAGRWTRYWMVDGGKVHAHDKCAMLSDRTILKLLHQHSGDHSDVVVGRFGHVLCARCFPDEPRPAKGRRATACSGTGKRPDWMHEPCPDCGKQVARTSVGVFRRHQP